MARSVQVARQDSARRTWCAGPWTRSTIWPVSPALCAGKSFRRESSCFLYRCACVCVRMCVFCRACGLCFEKETRSCNKHTSLSHASQGEKFLCEKCYQVSIQSLAASSAAATPMTLPTATTNMPKSEALKFGKLMPHSYSRPCTYMVWTLFMSPFPFSTVYSPFYITRGL